MIHVIGVEPCSIIRYSSLLGRRGRSQWKNAIRYQCCVKAGNKGIPYEHQITCIVGGLFMLRMMSTDGAISLRLACIPSHSAHRCLACWEKKSSYVLASSTGIIACTAKTALLLVLVFQDKLHRTTTRQEALGQWCSADGQWWFFWWYTGCSSTYVWICMLQFKSKQESTCSGRWYSLGIAKYYY